MTSDRLISAATQIQRWRDFLSHVTAYVVGNLILIGIWAVSGRGAFWPLWSLLVWGVGLSFQHFHQVLRGPITAGQAEAYLSRHPS
jgi:2TM domain